MADIEGAIEDFAPDQVCFVSNAECSQVHDNVDFPSVCRLE